MIVTVGDVQAPGAVNLDTAGASKQALKQNLLWNAFFERELLQSVVIHLDHRQSISRSIEMHLVRKLQLTTSLSSAAKRSHKLSIEIVHRNTVAFGVSNDELLALVVHLETPGAMDGTEAAKELTDIGICHENLSKDELVLERISSSP